MVKYLIIEDEPFAYKELKRMVDELRPDYLLTGWAQSVAQSVELLKSQDFDFILADISLADGLCFEIFEQTKADIPVIFTTAYDEYAIKAFKVNGVDYLLKPFEKEDLALALERLERRSTVTSASEKVALLNGDYSSSMPKNRFLVRTGDAYTHVPASDIAFFYSEDKYTFLHLFTGKRHIVDYSLDRLEELLDGEMFFRTSRNSIVNIRAVVRCTRQFGGRLKLYCQPEADACGFVSRSRAKSFLDWIDGII
ncbi:response regulator transcription factor [Palleniella muris]|uniref:Response regulator transcription factor n=1 Tax=Palleniella muris TaxID=3038145 RepID=A0AC61QUF1_9BACT|nr:LytTR family DNA-binding domain-containing protein [Palleniella muris]TGX84194.1 response regulator transcription factor [Palleniella muris]